jgi:hypothetical protein
MSQFIYLGMMVCSHRTSRLAEAVFDNVSVSGTIPAADRFQAEVAKTLQRVRGQPPRDPRLDEFDALAARRKGERTAPAFPAKQKLIAANIHSMPPLSQLAARWQDYQQRPFDGTVLVLQGGQRPFQRRPWDENRFLADYSYFPDGGFGEPFNYPRSGWIRTDEPKSEIEGGEGAVTAYQGHQIQGLVRWYLLSRDQEALDLAGRLTRFCMLPKFWGGLPDPEKRQGLVGHVVGASPDPVCIAGAEQGHWFSHFHARAIALRGILEYGMAVEDPRILEFVQRAYEYTWTLGIPRKGWVNTYPGAINRCEGCALGDLVALGIRLTDAGLGDYWDAVDAVVRNQLAEQQLIRADLLERISAAGPERPKDKRSPHPDQELNEDVIRRSIGIFGGTASPTAIPSASSMACCTNNGTQGLYYAWEGAARSSGDAAQVNLLLNRACQLLDVESHLPYEGKVVFRNKAARRVAVRVPSWVSRRQIRADVAGQTRPSAWAGNYLLFENLQRGDLITLTFPVKETTARYTVNARTPAEQVYTCVFRGSTLVDISPRDQSPTSYPLYQRQHLRTDKAPAKTVERFVASRSILHW